MNTKGESHENMMAYFRKQINMNNISNGVKKLLHQLKTRSHGVLYAAFVPLVPADYADSKKLKTLINNDLSLAQYLNTLFKVAITVGAILAVLRLLYAGYMYMASDVWTNKETAKQIFRDVFLGLFLLLSIFIILRQINPNLLNLKPEITPVKPSEVAPTGVPSAARCSGCVPIPAGVPVKRPGACAAATCVVSPTMANKLRTLAAKSAPESWSWRVTEAYPPTIAHFGPNSCHNNGLGTCVDANFIGATLPQNIIAFINVARSSDLTAQLEVRDQARKNQLIGLGVPEVSIWVTGNAEHFHITGG
jgi:hypothetical protein